MTLDAGQRCPGLQRSSCPYAAVSCHEFTIGDRSTIRDEVLSCGSHADRLAGVSQALENHWQQVQLSSTYLVRNAPFEKNDSTRCISTGVMLILRRRGRLAMISITLQVAASSLHQPKITGNYVPNCASNSKARIMSSWSAIPWPRRVQHRNHCLFSRHGCAPLWQTRLMRSGV